MECVKFDSKKARKKEKKRERKGEEKCVIFRGSDFVTSLSTLDLCTKISLTLSVYSFNRAPIILNLINRLIAIFDSFDIAGHILAP